MSRTVSVLFVSRIFRPLLTLLFFLLNIYMSKWDAKRLNIIRPITSVLRTFYLQFSYKAYNCLHYSFPCWNVRIYHVVTLNLHADSAPLVWAVIGDVMGIFYRGNEPTCSVTAGIIQLHSHFFYC